MWLRLFAFGMIILIILLFIQFSTMSDSEVEKIRIRVEEYRKAKKQDQTDSVKHPAKTEKQEPQVQTEH